MKQLNKLTKQVIGSAIKVHKKLGPGFVEKIYQRALKIELTNNRFKVQSEYPIQIKWGGKVVGKQKLDLLVNNKLILELKAQAKIEAIHLQQLLSYLKAGNKQLGLILNFGTKQLGIKRVINSASSVEPKASADSAIPKNESQKTQKSRKKRKRE